LINRQVTSRKDSYVFDSKEKARYYGGKVTRQRQRLKRKENKRQATLAARSDLAKKAESRKKRQLAS
jgi:hypothetical protein